MITGLFVFFVLPIVIIGLVINFIVTQYRVHNRDKKCGKYWRKNRVTVLWAINLAKFFPYWIFCSIGCENG